jgi:hypothetical protein
LIPGKVCLDSSGFVFLSLQVHSANLLATTFLQVEHFNTNIILPGGEDFVFRLTGTHKVHIFGHYLYQPVPPQLDEDQDPYGDGEYDSDEEIDSDDISESEMGMYDPESGLLIGSDSEDYDEDDDEEDADASARFMEIEEA